MNLFYTGLGIVRSLGERGVPVIGLTSRKGHYGNFTRYAKIRHCPDSRSEPDALLAFLVAMGQKLETRAVIFPTRDDDVVFLDRFRAELEPYFSLVLAGTSPLRVCLNKWETFLRSQEAGIASPKSCVVESREDIERVAAEMSYPCVLKPLSAHHWRQGANWEIVGARKAIGLDSAQSLLEEYDKIAQADKRALVQEMIPGGDENLVITACYLDRGSKWVAGFNIQKLVQVPEGFGTGCIVESVDRPELFAPARKILEEMGYSGIAEVEFKWDDRDRQFKLIEINPRPWDQHRLGKACGVDLMYIAYCEHAGLPQPPVPKPAPGTKWIADETFIVTALRLAWGWKPELSSLFRHAHGKRIYAVWNGKDPLPFLVWVVRDLIPVFVSAGIQRIGMGWKGKLLPATGRKEGALGYESTFEKPKGIH